MMEKKTATPTEQGKTYLKKARQNVKRARAVVKDWKSASDRIKRKRPLKSPR